MITTTRVLLPRFARQRRLLPLPLDRLVAPCPPKNRQFQQRYATLQQQALQPDPDPVPNNLANSDNIDIDDKKDGFHWRSTSFKMLETALTTFASIAILG